MKVSVLGCGRWGSFIAWYLNKIGHEVCIWGRAESRASAALLRTGKNEYLELPDSVVRTTDLRLAAGTAEGIVISISAQQLRPFAASVGQALQAAQAAQGSKPVILCMKGMEQDSGKRLSQVFAEGFGRPVDTAVWLGPGHVQDFLASIPNCMVIDSESEPTKEFFIRRFSSELIRFYYGTDLIGNEIGAAAKNVYGIAAGMLDGLRLSSLKGALMARGAREVSRLIGAMGGNPLSAYGLCHLGDYEATIFSSHSHNRKFGECYITGEAYGALAEGVTTCRAMMRLSAQSGVELPICAAVYAVLFERAEARRTLSELFTRTLKTEFHDSERADRN